MALNAGTAYMELQLRGRKQVTSELKGMNARLKRFGSTIKSIAAALGTAFVIKKTGDFLAHAIKRGSDMQETMNKFNVVFGKSSEEMKKFSDELAVGFGRSKEQVAGFLSSSQDLLVPMGLNAGAATDMSKGLATLAMDLGSFNNMADADVMRDLQAALTGSGEVMKKYGVIVSDAAVKQELLGMGLDPANVNDAQKAMARYNIILAGTTAAQGDVARSSESFANQAKSVWAAVDDLFVTIGEALLPILEDWMMDLQAAFSLLNDGADASDGMAGAVGFLTSALEYMMSPVELLIRAWKILSGLWKGAQSIMSELAEKVVWLAEKLVWLAAKVQRMAEDLGMGWAVGMDADALDQTVESLKAQREAIDKVGKKQWEDSGKEFSAAFGTGIRKSLDKARKKIRSEKEGANRELTKVDKATAASAGTAGKKTTKQVKTGGKLESLEATSAAAFNRFYENKQNEELRELQKLNKAMAAAPIARVAQ